LNAKKKLYIQRERISAKKNERRVKERRCFNVVGNHRERKISGKEETSFYALPSYSYFHFHFSK
jgi:hypothetical protein